MRRPRRLRVSHIVCRANSETAAATEAPKLAQASASSMRNQSLSFKTVREFSRIWKDTSKFGSKVRDLARRIPWANAHKYVSLSFVTRLLS
jgi:hypothetical protein